MNRGTNRSAAQSPHAARAWHARSRYRSQSHDSAHAADQDASNGSNIDHPLIARGEALLITQQEDLQSLIDHLRSEGSFAYDSEFIGELTYVPKLCLIQVASRQKVALIDPLSPQIDLLPFWELLADPAVEKIVHAGQQDIEPVYRNTGRAAASMFDTQIAAGFVALAWPVALGKLVKEMLGVRLGKGLTFTHWDQRPLSPMQLRYAADDVRYLPALRQAIGERLDTLGHTRWAEDEFAALCEPLQYVFNPETYFLKVRGASSLQPGQMAVLRELTVWRDRVAREHNVPARSLLRDEILIDMSRNPVKSVEKLTRVRGLPRPVEQAHGAELVEATLRGLSVPPEKLPRTHSCEPTPAQRFGSDAIWAAAQCICIGQSIDPALVASRQEMSDFYFNHVINPNPPAAISPIMQGWRREALGEPLLKLIDGDESVRLHWSDGGLKFSPTTS